MAHINAREYVGTGFPTDEGTKLADELLGRDELPWKDLTIDLTGCAAGLLISAFFNAFLQEVYETSPEKLDAARKIEWKLLHDFQAENVATWMTDFEPTECAS